MSHALDPEFNTPASKVMSRQAWTLCWLMFASTVLNYMDRQAVSVVSERITGEFDLKFEQFGWVIAAFQLSYAFFQVPAGFLTDRLDVRWTYAGAVLWWSLAAMAVAWSPTFGLLLGFRAILGVGEAFNWPCALKVTGNVLPPEDRGLGNGIFNSGAAVGAVLTPLILTPLTLWFGWRWSFALIGACGLIWVAIWLFSTRVMADRLHAFDQKGAATTGSAWTALGPFVFFTALVLGAGGWGYFRIGLPAFTWAIAGLMTGWLLLSRVMSTEALAGSSFTASLGRVVRINRFWVMCVVSVSINVCWHFLVNWLPTYLKTDRGMPFVAGSLLSAVPFLAADVGNLGGGAASRKLAQAGRTPAQARMLVVVGCVLLISLGAFVGSITSTTLTMIILALMAFGTAAFMANYFAFCQDVSARDTGLIVGILGGLGNLFAAAFAPVAGRIKDQTGSFGPVFVLVALLPLLGLGMLTLGWRSELFGTKPKRTELEV